MKLGRNDPCHCGSGEKYKKCHLQKDEAAASAARAAEATAKAAAAAEALAAAEEEAKANPEKAAANAAAAAKEKGKKRADAGGGTGASRGTGSGTAPPLHRRRAVLSGFSRGERSCRVHAFPDTTFGGKPPRPWPRSPSTSPK